MGAGFLLGALLSARLQLVFASSCTDLPGPGFSPRPNDDGVFLICVSPGIELVPTLLGGILVAVAVWISSRPRRESQV